MTEKILWKDDDQISIDNEDIVNVAYKDYMGFAYLIFRDCYGEGRMTMTVEKFVEMASAVIVKLKTVAEVEPTEEVGVLKLDELGKESE